MKRSIFLSLSLLIALTSLAAPVRIVFKIQDYNGNSLEGTTVKLYKMNRLMMAEEHAPAILKWVLEEGENYTIEVSHNGFVTKRMGITTQAIRHPDDAQRFIVALEASSFTDEARPEHTAGLPSEVLHYENGQWTLNSTGVLPQDEVREPEKLPVPSGQQ